MGQENIPNMQVCIPMPVFKLILSKRSRHCAFRSIDLAAHTALGVNGPHLANKTITLGLPHRPDWGMQFVRSDLGQHILPFVGLSAGLPSQDSQGLRIPCIRN